MDAKMKKVVIATSIIGALAVVTTALILRSRRKKLEKKIENGSQDVIVPASETTTQVIFPLKKGSGYNNVAENNAVKVVQRYINAKGTVGTIVLFTLDEDGMFGPQTESALYKLASVKEVSYSYYKEMSNYLIEVPFYLNKDSANTDPNVTKNSLMT
jgi:hypothetical protein